MANKTPSYGGIDGVFSLWPALNYLVLIKAMNGGLVIIFLVGMTKKKIFMQKKQNLSKKKTQALCLNNKHQKKPSADQDRFLLALQQK